MADGTLLQRLTDYAGAACDSFEPALQDPQSCRTCGLSLGPHLAREAATEIRELQEDLDAADGLIGLDIS